jgi:hypothetical protein
MTGPNRACVAIPPVQESVEEFAADISGVPTASAACTLPNII